MAIAVQVSPNASLRATTSFYRPELDALRFLAFLAVFIHHSLPKEADFYSERGIPQVVAAFIATTANAGNFGVDLFFLLSSYLITTLLLREREAKGKIDIKSFYIRRILRIWPLYFLALAIGEAWQWIVPGDALSWQYVVAYMLLVGNWMHVFFGERSSIMLILWSVAVEEQFYLTWPALLRKINTRQMLIRFGVALWIGTITARYCFAKAGFTGAGIGHNTLTRLDTIAAGILMAAVLNGNVIRFSTVNRIGFAAAGIGGFIFSAYQFSYGLPAVIWSYTLVALSSVMLFLSFIGVTGFPRAMVYLGKISFGLYIFHRLCLRVSGFIWGAHMKSYAGYAGLMITAFCLTVLISMLSYKVYESPFLRLKERFAKVQSRPV
ncbi:MAG TPA: acyltransferase [Terriglobales bacterium]